MLKAAKEVRHLSVDFSGKHSEPDNPDHSVSGSVRFGSEASYVSIVSVKKRMDPNNRFRFHPFASILGWAEYACCDLALSPQTRANSRQALSCILKVRFSSELGSQVLYVLHGILLLYFFQFDEFIFCHDWDVGSRQCY
jgi:hypothetical protein